MTIIFYFLKMVTSFKILPFYNHSYSDEKKAILRILKSQKIIRNLGFESHLNFIHLFISKIIKKIIIDRITLADSFA